MLSLAELLLIGPLPGVVALAMRWLLLALTKRDGVAWPAAVAAGFVAGQAGLLVREGAASTLLAPREASQWLPLAAGLAALIAPLVGGRGLALAAGLFAAVALAIGLPIRLLWGSVYLLSEWSPSEAAARITAIAAGLLGVGWLVTKHRADRSTARSSGPAETEDIPTRETLSGVLIVPLLLLVALGVAVVLATSGSLSYARLAGVLVASLVGATLGGVGRLPFTEIAAGVPAAGPVVTVVAGGLLLLGVLYAEVTTLNAPLLTAALAAAGAKRGWAPRCQWRQAVLRGMACLVPLTVAMALSVSKFQAATTAEPDNPYLNWAPSTAE